MVGSVKNLPSLPFDKNAQMPLASGTHTTPFCFDTTPRAGQAPAAHFEDFSNHVATDPAGWIRRTT